MSKKEGYIPTEEARMRAKDKAKNRAAPRGRSGFQEQAYGGSVLVKLKGGGTVEMGSEMVGDRSIAIKGGDESRLTEYVDRCLANIELARQRMSNDQIEIDRLRKETRSLISDLMIA